jgi:hypothetical protein
LDARAVLEDLDRERRCFVPLEKKVAATMCACDADVMRVEGYAAHVRLQGRNDAARSRCKRAMRAAGGLT